MFVHINQHCLAQLLAVADSWADPPAWNMLLAVQPVKTSITQMSASAATQSTPPNADPAKKLEFRASSFRKFLGFVPECWSTAIPTMQLLPCFLDRGGCGENCGRLGPWSRDILPRCHLAFSTSWFSNLHRCSRRRLLLCVAGLGGHKRSFADGDFACGSSSGSPTCKLACLVQEYEVLIPWAGRGLHRELTATFRICRSTVRSLRFSQDTPLNHFEGEYNLALKDVQHPTVRLIFGKCWSLVCGHACSCTAQRN